MTPTTTAGFQLIHLDAELRPAHLVSREWLTPGYVRLRLAGEALTGFASPGADDHVRLFLGDSGRQEPSSPEQWRELPSREYTPVAFGAGWVEFDLVVHGDGPGSAWAATAPLGSPAAVGGPRRSNQVVGDPQAWFLAGDETAVPAISRFLHDRSEGTPAWVVLEVSRENSLVPVPADAATTLTVLVREDGGALAAHLGDLTADDRPQGAVIGFVAGEAGVVAPARELLQDRWGLAAEAVIAKGYWRRA